MVKSQNTLNLKSNNKNTYTKSISSRPQIDSLSKKEKFFKTEIESDQSSVDDNRRLFLKVAGVAGLGLAASALFPKSADAYVSGSTPTSNVVGMRNASNVKINPATEDTLALIKAKSDLLTFDSGVNPANLKVNIAAGNIGLKNLSDVSINPATEDTLALIKTQTDKFAFNASNKLESVVSVKDTQDRIVNPATEDSVVLLRRIVKLMESQAVVDSGNRQRVTIDSLGTGTAITNTVPVSGTVTVGTITTVSTVTNIASIAGQNQQMYQDVARTSFATGIRNNLLFT